MSIQAYYTILHIHSYSDLEKIKPSFLENQEVDSLNPDL